jgi:AcrR family transcriptional regulator
MYYIDQAVIQNKAGAIMSPRSRELSKQMKAESRKAVVSAALELFAKKGFSATTADEIAKKAKVSKGLIFTHFATKQDILLAIVDEQLERLFPIAFGNDDARSPRDKFLALINAWLNVMKDDPLLIRLTLQLNLDDAWRKLVKRKGKRYIEIYLGGLRDLIAQLGSKNPDLDCYLIAIFFDGIAANYTVAPELFPIDAVKDHFVEMLLSRWKKSPKR